MAQYTVTQVQESLNIQGKIAVTTLECPDDVNAVQYTEEFDYLMAGYSDGGIRAIKDLKSVFTLQDDMSSRTFSTGLKHRPVSRNYPITNTFMCTYGNGLLKCWNYNFKECTFTSEEKRLTTGISYHPKISKYVTFGDNKKIYVYDEDSKRQERVLSASDEKTSTNGHTNTVTCACFHPKNVNELISGGLDNTIQFWDTRQPNAMRNVSGVIVAGPGLEFSPKGTEFVTCSPDPRSGPTLRLWDYGSGKEVQKLEPDKYKLAPLRCGTYLSKTQFVCGGGEPNFLRVVDMNTLHTEALITNIQNPVKSITIGTGSGVPEFSFCAGKRIYIVRPK